jgi:hypothetical protein
MLPIDGQVLPNRVSRGTDPPRTRQAGRLQRFTRVPALAATTSVKPKSRALSPAAARQFDQLPAFLPLLEDVEVAGWSSHRRRLSGNFHDWLLLDDGRLLVAVGQAVGIGLRDSMEAALVAQAAWTAIRAHAFHARDAGVILSLAARSLWAIPTATTHASVAVALVDTLAGSVSLAMAGDALAWRIRAATSEQLPSSQPPLGIASDVSYPTHWLELSLRERLLLLADDSSRRSGRLTSAIASRFSHLNAESHRRMTAGDALTLTRDAYEQTSEKDPLASASIVAVRRR